MHKLGSKIFVYCFALCISTPILAAKTDGARIAKQGNGKGALACIACHGQKGEGNPAAGFPYLAGLPAVYIKNQLHALQKGSRNNAVMKAIASNLSDAEITAVADFYASLKPPKVAKNTDGVTADNSIGAGLAISGKWSAGTPACFKCHGENGTGIAPHFPPIAGQPFTYIKNQLQDWQNGKRRNDPQGLMQAVANSLNQQEIESVAHFLSALHQ